MTLNQTPSLKKQERMLIRQSPPLKHTSTVLIIALCLVMSIECGSYKQYDDNFTELNNNLTKLQEMLGKVQAMDPKNLTLDQAQDVQEFYFDVVDIQDNFTKIVKRKDNDTDLYWIGKFVLNITQHRIQNKINKYFAAGRALIWIANNVTLKLDPTGQHARQKQQSKKSGHLPSGVITQVLYYNKPPQTLGSGVNQIVFGREPMGANSRLYKAPTTQANDPAKPAVQVDPPATSSPGISSGPANFSNTTTSSTTTTNSSNTTNTVKPPVLSNQTSSVPSNNASTGNGNVLIASAPNPQAVVEINPSVINPTQVVKPETIAVIPTVIKTSVSPAPTNAPNTSTPPQTISAVVTPNLTTNSAHFLYYCLSFMAIVLFFS